MAGQAKQCLGQAQVIFKGSITVKERSSSPETPEKDKISLGPEVFEDFFSLSLGLLCIADLSGKFLSVNPEWTRVLGHTREQLDGQSFLDLVHPDDKEATLTAMAVLSEGREVTGFENRFRAKDGSYRWIQWRSKAKGAIIYAAAKDITQIKSQLYDLERMSNFFQKTNEVARVGGWEVDFENQRVWWSDVTREIHECGPDYEPTLEAGINFYLEGEDRETIRREFKKAATEGIGFDLELQIVTAKGRRCWIRTVGKPVWENGRIVRVFGAFQDIDDYKKTFLKTQEEEAKLRGLFELADVGIAMNDFKDGHFLMGNDKLIEPTGYSRKEFLELSYWQITPKEYAEEEQNQISQLRLKGRYGPYEKEYIRKDGSRYPVRLSGFLMRDRDNREVIWSIIQDISKEKETEENLRTIAQKAEEGSRAKSAFLATMSHEIRTPLNGVIGGAELLRTTQLTEDQESYAQIIHQSGELLLSTINDILDFSKIESGRIELENGVIDLTELVEGLIDTVTPLVYRKRIELVYLPAQNVPRYLIGDPTRLSQILLNLLSNAIKFTEHGHVAIKVSMEDDGKILFQVQDTGIGIPANRVAEIFLPFTQAESSTTRKFGGTGLGLSIAHRLVALMGGELDLESSVGRGTRFFFKLLMPIAEAPPANIEEDAIELSGTRILILEDVAINQKLLTQTLEGARASVCIVKSWQDFLARDFTNVSFDLILFDRFFGQGELSRTTQLIQSKCGENPKTLMLAGDVTGIPEGTCDGTLQKPIKPRHLLNQCHKLLALGSRRTTEPQTSRDSSKPDPPRFPWKVLIVDDNHLNQMIARNLLQHFGFHEIHLANNGQEALVAWEKLQPDLVFMDCQMPNMDGYEATRAIRSKESERGAAHGVHIIGLSAATIQGDRDKALRAGMDEYLTKPLQLTELLSAIEKFEATIKDGAIQNSISD